MKLFCTFILIIVLCSCRFQNNGDLANYSAEPADSAALFGEGFISTKLNEYNITFSPDGLICLFTIANNSSLNRFYTIFITEKKNGNWTKPKIAPFSGRYSDADPFFAPSGDKVYFISTRPSIPGLQKSDFDIWSVHYKDGHFNSPQHLGSEVNTSNDELYPSVSLKGNLFFSTENDKSGHDLMVSFNKGGHFEKPVSLGDSVNTENIEFDAFIAPDESFIIYTGMNYKDSFGSGDLYISYKKGRYWTKGRNLGNRINSVHMEQCPTISPDGKYIYFTSFRDSQPHKTKGTMTTDEYLDILNSPLNGLGDIFRAPFKN